MCPIYLIVGFLSDVSLVAFASYFVCLVDESKT